MRYRRQTALNDYSFGNSQHDFLTDLDAVVQAIRTRLLLLKNEWWEDLDDGLPLFQSILQKPGTPENVDAAALLIQDRILETPGVTQIKDYSGAYSNRQYSVSCTVDTIYGIANVEVSI